MSWPIKERSTGLSCYTSYAMVSKADKIIWYAHEEESFEYFSLYSRPIY